MFKNVFSPSECQVSKDASVTVSLIPITTGREHHLRPLEGIEKEVCWCRRGLHGGGPSLAGARNGGCSGSRSEWSSCKVVVAEEFSTRTPPCARSFRGHPKPQDSICCPCCSIRYSSKSGQGQAFLEDLSHPPELAFQLQIYDFNMGIVFFSISRSLLYDTDASPGCLLSGPFRRA